MKIPKELEDVFRGVELTEDEIRTLTWIAGWKSQTVENLRSAIQKVRATALSALQAENEKLRDELEQVKAERDAAIKELDEVTSEVDDLADFVDREIHPVIDYNLYLDLRENVDAVSMFQHEDEWRGLHKEE